MLLQRIIYDKKALVNELVERGGKAPIKKLYHVLKKDRRILLQDVVHFYFIDYFGQSPFPNYDPQPIPKALIPKMEPSEFAQYISDLLKGLIKDQ